MNRRQAPRLADLILARLPAGGTVGVLGLSYKPHTDVIDESQGVALAHQLLKQEVRVVVYDPMAMGNAQRVLTGNITFAGSAVECAEASDVLALTTDWPEFRELRPENLKNGGVHSTVVDCWRLLDRDAFISATDYVILGLCPDGGPVWETAAASVRA